MGIYMYNMFFSIGGRGIGEESSALTLAPFLLRLFLASERSETRGIWHDSDWQQKCSLIRIVCFNKVKKAPLGACVCVFLFVLTVWNFHPILLELQEFPAWMKCQVLLCGDYADLAGIQVPCISTLTVWKDWHDHVINYTMVFNKIFRPVKEICTCTDNSPKWPHHVFPIRFLTDSEDSHVRSSNLFFVVGRLGSYSEKS